MADSELADMLLAAGEQDILACEALSPLPHIGDGIIGFHAQQSVEKSLKSVLVRAGIVFRRTHDLAELLDLMSDQGVAAPPHADWLDELNPYGVAARYGLVVTRQLDRPVVLTAVREVWRWAATYRPGPGDVTGD